MTDVEVDAAGREFSLIAMTAALTELGSGGEGELSDFVDDLFRKEMANLRPRERERFLIASWRELSIIAGGAVCALGQVLEVNPVELWQSFPRQRAGSSDK